MPSTIFFSTSFVRLVQYLFIFGASKVQSRLQHCLRYDRLTLKLLLPVLLHMSFFVALFMTLAVEFLQDSSVRMHLASRLYQVDARQVA